MDQDLVDEINYLLDLLTKSGFFSASEILEILEDQFIDENVDFSKFNISLNDFNNFNFSKLEYAFEKLSKKSIICVHNCGYDFEEGVDDIFELYVHLINNKYNAQGFCFYTFEDVEYAINDNILKLTFGDFERSETKSLEVGKMVYNCLDNADFDVMWDESINTPIEIHNFVWDKNFDENKEYEIEEVYDFFIGVINEE